MARSQHTAHLTVFGSEQQWAVGTAGKTCRATAKPTRMLFGWLIEVLEMGLFRCCVSFRTAPHSCTRTSYSSGTSGTQKRAACPCGAGWRRAPAPGWPPPSCACSQLTCWQRCTHEANNGHSLFGTHQHSHSSLTASNIACEQCNVLTPEACCIFFHLVHVPRHHLPLTGSYALNCT